MELRRFHSESLLPLLCEIFSLQILFADMTKPEQELLAKYLLEQLISRDEEIIADPVVARLAREEAGDILESEGSQTIATIVPAPPGIDSGDKKNKDQCKIHMLRGCVMFS